MKLLMIYCDYFGYTPSLKTLPDFPEDTEPKVFENVLTAFIQMEAEDENDPKYLETKLVKSLKWAAKKNETKHIILHSFAHLSMSKASPVFTKEFFDVVEKRLLQTGYQVGQTPFGYFLDLDMKAPGRSSARIFKSFEVKSEKNDH